MLMSVRLVQLLKVSGPILVTELGMLMSVSLVQLLKAPSSIPVTELGRFIFDMAHGLIGL